MGVSDASINNIMGGIENTGGVRMHNHKKKLKQRFDIIKKLGQGTYGKVQLGINKETGQEVAIKTIKKSKIQLEADLVRIRREIQIMSSVQHPNIIHIYEVFENREKMVLVMEYAAGGELYDYLSERKVLPEEEARRIFRQIATACYYCHKHKICHRDLKLENILLDENSNAKIADFGLSNVFDDQRLLNTFCGSPLYASPEIVRGTPYHGPEVDCWSLGVLLYTLVYGAMPFDGSNFKRLVKQISQGDYFEPQKPSPASPLIREMLTVNPRNRADIEKICSHWWVNESYDESCLDISEDLANQTPVRLDLLLSLAPPPPQLESEKLMVTGEGVEDMAKTEAALPTRSQSAGSLLDLKHPAERRIKELINEEKISPKRKLESTLSTDRANLSSEGLKRKDKIIKENTIADITVHGTIQENASQEDASMSELMPLNKSLTQTISREMDVEQTDVTDPSLQGAVCSEIIKEAEKNETNKTSTTKETAPSPIAEKTNDNSLPIENVSANVDKENVQENVQKEKSEIKTEEPASAVKRKVIKKKVLNDKNDNIKQKTNDSQEPVKIQKEPEKQKNGDKTENKTEPALKTEEAPPKQVERRRSRIFETAEKFQNLISANESKTTSTNDKPKKIVIPGVSVDGFKKEFERKASLTSETPPPNLKSIALRKKFSVDNTKSVDEEAPVKEKSPEIKETDENKTSEPINNVAVSETFETKINPDDERKERVKNAVSIISSALDKEGTRKSKSRPCMVRKPPIPFGASGRSASASIGMISTPFSPTEEKQCFKVQVGPNASDTRIATVEVSTPEHTRYAKNQPEKEDENKTSSAEITLKSATLPRRKTTKAEIRLDYPTPKPATMEFKTEMATHVEAPPKIATQRSEVTFPVTSPPAVEFRASSLEPENRSKPKERIIQISLVDSNEKKESVQSPPPTKPPMPRAFQNQKSYQSQRSSSLSRQSTLESDSETTGSREPIRKSPREYIIPIAVEGGGYVTPRAGSLEPSETSSTTSTMTNSSRRPKFSKLGRRLDSVFGDRDGSEDESPFSTLHRHSSFGRESDTEDSKRDAFHMHRLRSSRPRKSALEHNDSLSSGEDDDDDGFEILTAENLFSTLLSRVRDLTQRLNVEDGGRPGFPSSRLLSHFDHRGTNFWNMHNRLDPLSRPLGRTFSQESSTTNSNNQFGVPWRRSVSRDLASDIESIFKNPTTPTHTSTLPRGDNNTKKEILNLADLDLKKLKLSDEDALALSYLTPGLSRRIQKQLLSQLAPSEARKLSRTLSMQNENKSHPNKASDTSEEINNYGRRSFDRISSTLPRRCSIDKVLKDSANAKASEGNAPTEDLKANEDGSKGIKSFLPVKSRTREECSPLNNRNTQSEHSNYKKYKHNKDTISDSALAESYRRPRAARSISLREPKVDVYPIYSPDSSISDRNDDSYKNTDSDVSSKIYGQEYSLIHPTYVPESSTLSKYLSPNKYYDSSLDKNKTDIRRPSYSTRKISRFLRPDFYDTPKEESTYLKEKKEREMETQKVLKEIRDKRIKNRINMRRERSASRDNRNNDNKDEVKVDNISPIMNPNTIPSTDALLKTVSDNIKKLESNVKTMPTYVNVSVEDNENKNVVVKKERVSKLARPKSYPIESSLQEGSPKLSVSPEKEPKSKISRLKKVSPVKTSKIDEPVVEVEKEKTTNKNKFLQSLEKKFEKLRSLSNTPTDSTDDCKAEKKSGVENTIKRLREQSLPRNLEHCTESGLIKRAVSVEDLTVTGNSKTLQASRKSVSKILGLFKKYEERDSKKNEKVVKTKKTKESSNNMDAKALNKTKTNKEEGANTVIANDKSEKNKTDFLKVKKKLQKACSVDEKCDTSSEKKLERPRSLLFDRAKHFNGAKSDTILNEENTKLKVSKLPVNSLTRRSLNLENVSVPKTDYAEKPVDAEESRKLDRKNLKLDLSKLPTRNKEPLIYIEPTPSTSAETPQEFKDYRNSITTPEDSSMFLSPCDDVSCDSWSVCSDYCANELSPVSPNGHIYSGDENESVIDRIRRKSFYTRFNEKKRPRKTSLTGNYKDLDLYKDVSVRSKSVYRPSNDYSSLDRRSIDYRSPLNRYSIQEPSRKSHGKNSVLFTHDGYVNVPNRYQTYNPRISRHVSPLYSDFEDNAVDDGAPGRTRKYSSHTKPSMLGRSISPMSEQSFDETSSSSFVPNSVNSFTSHNAQ